MAGVLQKKGEVVRTHTGTAPWEVMWQKHLSVPLCPTHWALHPAPASPMQPPGSQASFQTQLDVLALLSSPHSGKRCLRSYKLPKNPRQMRALTPNHPEHPMKRKLFKCSWITRFSMCSGTDPDWMQKTIQFHPKGSVVLANDHTPPELRDWAARRGCRLWPSVPCALLGRCPQDVPWRSAHTS